MQDGRSNPYSFFVLQVLIPKGRYSGQKPIKLVRKNTMAKTTSTMPNTPEIVPL
jgi:hypothetical protein